MTHLQEAEPVRVNVGNGQAGLETTTLAGEGLPLGTLLSSWEF